MNEFLSKHGWSAGPGIAGDASARRYFRVSKAGQTAILMEASAEPETIAPFVAIGNWINRAGLKAPAVLEADEGAGLLLLEDLGGISFGAALRAGRDRRELYTLAADVLARLREATCDLDLPAYEGSPLHRGHRRVIDWYVPALRGQINPDGLAAAYAAAWAEIEKSLPPCPQSFIHADYHLENLMWVEGESGLKRCGIIDFQDALVGPAAYDLGNLLEDARVNVPGELQKEILAGQDDAFRAWYRVLATQFHCRVIGQFVKLAVNGKTQYLPHIPRLAAYIEGALADPLLAPLQKFFREEKISFRDPAVVDPQKVKAVIRSDAY